LIPNLKELLYKKRKEKIKIKKSVRVLICVLAKSRVGKRIVDALGIEIEPEWVDFIVE